eukprot:1519125-Rhodomonas_salina.2
MPPSVCFLEWASPQTQREVEGKLDVTVFRDSVTATLSLHTSLALVVKQENYPSTVRLRMARTRLRQRRFACILTPSYWQYYHSSLQYGISVSFPSHSPDASRPLRPHAATSTLPPMPGPLPLAGPGPRPGCPPPQILT